MRNEKTWQPSKVLYCDRRQRYVENPRYVSLGSHYLVSVLAPAYAKLIAAHVTGRLLDCGCGDVPFYGMYRSLTSEIVCVDWDATVHGSSHLDHSVDLNCKLALADARFDSVLLADVLEHIHAPTLLINEIGRVLAPAGKLLLLVPFLYRVHEEPHDYHRYTRFALERLCIDAGLRVVSIDAYGGYPDVLLDLFNKGLQGVPFLCKLWLPLAKGVSRLASFQRWRARTAERFPLGYCVVAQKA